MPQLQTQSALQVVGVVSYLVIFCCSNNITGLSVYFLNIIATEHSRRTCQTAAYQWINAHICNYAYNLKIRMLNIIDSQSATYHETDANT
jgi:hypothetical protein